MINLVFYLKKRIEICKCKQAHKVGGGVLINQNFIRCQTSSIQQETFLFNKKIERLTDKNQKKAHLK